MDLNALLLFTKVVQSGSLTAAARDLGLPKSTVSRRLAQLEADLGARLLQRTTRKLGLTDVGTQFYQRCAQIMSAIEEAALAVTEMQAAPRGTLRVTAPVDLGVALLGPVLRALRDRYPALQVEVVLTDLVLDLVEEGLDVAIRAGVLGDSSLMVRKLGVAQRMLCASPAYLAERGAPRAPADLPGHDCILFRAGGEGAVWQLEGPDGMTELHIESMVTVNNYDLVREAALAGVGIAMLPAFRCVEDIRAGRLHRVLDGWCSAGIQLNALYPSARHLSPKVKVFLDLLRDLLQDRLHMV